MRKITAGLFIAADGVVENPHEWHFPYFNDEMGAAVTEQLGSADTVLFGRVTYDVFAGAWPAREDAGGEDVPMAKALGDARKIVVSHSELEFTWRNSEQLQGDLEEAVTALKQEDGGPIGISGSVSVVRALLAAGLVDELHLFVHPIAIGKGLRLFDDHALPLTGRGWQQAEETGKTVREVFGRERVSVYVSPYRRTHETLRAFHLDPDLIRVREEPRLREQDWGNWQDRDDVRLQKAYRDAYGHFFYRFAQGESGADVYDRVGGFLESLFRSFEAPDHPPNVLLVTHGLAMRLFCMRWFHWTVAEFESLSNPGNAEMRMLVLGDDDRYTLDRPFDRWRDPESYGIGR